MITFFSGTPGSGKSLEACQEVERWLKTYKKNVIANVQYNKDYILRGKKGGRFFYLDNIHFKPDFFYKYALKFHDLGVEHQSLIVIDEAQVLYSPTACKLFSKSPVYPAYVCNDCKEKKCPRDMCKKLPLNSSYRQDWLEFFTQHRHLGFDILMISQFDKLVDSQIRCCFEYNYVHRKANNFRTIGKLFTIFGVQCFMQVQYWYGAKDKSGGKMFFYKKKYSKMYDSYAYRTRIVAKLKSKYGEDFVEQLVDPVKYAKRKELEKQEKIKKDVENKVAI